MAPRLIAANDPLFLGLDNAARQVESMAGLLHAATHEPTIPESLHPNMKEQLARVRGVLRELHDEAERRFITPIEREDLHLLAVSIEDVAADLEAIAGRMDAYQLRHPNEPLRWFTTALKDMAGLLVTVLRALHTLDPAQVRDSAARVEAVATAVDGVVRDSRRHLMSEPRGAYDLVRWKDMYDAMETASEQGRKLARAARHVLVRHS